MKSIFYLIVVFVSFLYIPGLLRLYKLNTVSHLYLQGFSCAFVFVLLAALFSAISHGVGDYSYISMVITWFMLILRYFFLYVISCKWLKCEWNLEIFMTLYIRAMCLYIFVTLIFLAMPEFREIWGNLIVTSDRNMEIAGALLNISRFGLQGYSGLMHTYMCDIGIIFTLFLLHRYIKRHQHIGKLLVYIIVLFVGTLCYSRTGVLFALLAISFYFLYVIVIGKNIRLLFMTLLGCVSIGVVITYLVSVVPEAEIWFNWAFEPFVNYIETGKFSTSSSDHLQTMYFVPNLDAIVWGEGYYTDPFTLRYYKSTDVGFLRPILYYGLFPTLIGYSMLLFLLGGIYKCSKKYVITGGKMMVVMLFLQFAFFEIKGEAFYIMFPVLFIILLICIQDNRAVCWK